MPSPNSPKKPDRRDEARAKAAALRAAQERKAKRTRIIAISGLGVAVVALGVVVALILRQGAANEEAYGSVVYGGGSESLEVPALADVENPTPSDASGGVPVSNEGVGTDGVGVDVQVYLDFQCPYCQQFDAANAAPLAALVGDGTITVTYHMMSFLDAQSGGTNYSTRAANAAAIVAQDAPEQFVDFTTTLFENQPAEGGSGLTDAEIAGLAQDVGVPSSVTDTFTETVTGTYTDGDGEQEGTWRTYAPWVAALTDQARTDLGQLSTPTILIDGEKFSGNPLVEGPLEEAITAAAG